MKQLRKAEIKSQLIDQTKISQSHHPLKIVQTLSLNEAKDRTKILDAEKTRAAGEENLTQTESLESIGSKAGIRLTQTKHLKKTASLQIVSENLHLRENLPGGIKSHSHGLKLEIETGTARLKVQVQEVEAVVVTGLAPQIQPLMIEEGIVDKRTRIGVEARVEELKTKKYLKVVGIRARNETMTPRKTGIGAQNVMILEESMRKIGIKMWHPAFLPKRSPLCKSLQILPK